MLIEKKERIKRFIKNWCPISLASGLARVWLISYINIYHLFAINHINFSLICRLVGVLFLEAKYDRFRNGDERTWLKHRE